MATDAKPVSPDHADDRRKIPRPTVLAYAWLPALALFCGTLALYWTTRTRFNTFDAVSYANQIGRLYPQTGNRIWLFHPHHVLFNVTGYLLWRLARALGYGGGPLIVLQSLNAVLGAVGITLFYLTLRYLLQRSRWLPFLVAAGLALTFGYWVCATDGRVNMPSTVLMLAALAVLCRLMEGARVQQAAWTGTLAGLAVLYHESAGLFFFVGLAAVWLAQIDPLLLPDAARRERMRLLLAYTGAWLGIVLAPYLLVGIFGLDLRSPSGFRHWMTSYAELGWWWNWEGWHNFRMDVYALRHAAFVEPAGKQGTFHLSSRTPQALRDLYFATLAGWFVAVYAFLVALPLLWRSHYRRVMIVCVLWLVLYAAFFTVWNPGYFVFWVPVLIPTGLLLALAMALYRARRGGLLVNWLVGTWVVMLATVNIADSIAPHLRPAASPFQRAAADIKAHTQPGDVIVVAGAGDGAQCEVDIPYFANRDVVSLHTALTRAHEDKDSALTKMTEQIAGTLQSGHAVYVLDEVHPVRFNTRTWDALHKRHPVFALTDLKTLYAPYRLTRAWTGPRGPVWQLIP